MLSNVDTESSSIHSKEIELKPLVKTITIDTTTTPNLTSNNSSSTRTTTTSPTSHTGHNEFGSPGSATEIQVAVNIFISFVGSGMLGMPYAFKQSGWVLGCLCLCLISSLNVYAMNLLIQTRKKLESNGHKDINGYGCVGRVVSGDHGEKLVNVCLVISQIGFSTAYIIFIAANLNNIWGVNRAYICFGCVPILAMLVQLQDMKHLSPFSLLADVSNLAGLVAVMVQDWKAYESYHEKTIAFDFHNILYVSSVALYCKSFDDTFMYMYVCFHDVYITHVDNHFLSLFFSQHWKVLEWFFL
jgi:proton-coupled amino acid transporter